MKKGTQILLAAGAAAVLASISAPVRAQGIAVIAPPVQPFVVPQPVLVPQPIVVQPQWIVLPPLPPIADLVVPGYRISWMRSTEGILKRILVYEVRNVGTAPTPQCLAAVSLGEAQPLLMQVPALLPGRAAALMVDTGGIVSRGTLVRIQVDCRNEVFEQDKGNNTLIARWMPE